SDTKAKDIIVRIPWGKLLMTDPSSQRAFFGFDAGGVRTVASVGIDLSVFELDEGRNPGNMRQARITGRYPAATNAMPARYLWRSWEKVAPEPYLKKSFYSLQKAFLEQTREANPKDGSRADAVGMLPSHRPVPESSNARR